MSNLLSDITEISTSNIRGVTEIELSKLGDKEREYVVLVAEQPYTGATNQSIMNDLGISKGTFYNWRDKHGALINRISTANMDKLKPKLLQATAQLLNSTNGTNVAKGADLYLKLEKEAQKEADGNDFDKQLKALVVGMQVLVKALDVKDIKDAENFVGLFTECAVEHMVRKEIPTNTPVKQLKENILAELGV